MSLSSQFTYMYADLRNLYIFTGMNFFKKTAGGWNVKENWEKKIISVIFCEVYVQKN